MREVELAQLRERCRRASEPSPWEELGRALHRSGRDAEAAGALDRALGLGALSEAAAALRAALLDGLALVEHGLTWRYVPAGPFRMGSDDGEPDEGPIREVELDAFHLMEVPMSWGDHCRLMGWAEPAEGGMPPEVESPSDPDGSREERFRLYYVQTKQRWAYCGGPGGEDAGALDRPMVSVPWEDAEELAAMLTERARAEGSRVTYRLPGEAEWEKAARGGLPGRRYANGEREVPTSGYDLDRFGTPGLLPSKHFPPNGYGFYAMCGGVWEWTRDWYDAAAPVHGGPPVDLPEDVVPERALRGGSWADCPEVCTVSYRMSLASMSWRRPQGPNVGTPTVGYRLLREGTDGG